MSRREVALLAALVVGWSLVVVGVALVSVPAGWITAGLGVIGLAVLTLAEVGGGGA